MNFNLSFGAVQDCTHGEQYCKDDLLIDWLPRGDQIYHIVRGCSRTPADDECTGGHVF